MKPKLIVETKLLHSASAVMRNPDATVYETSIKTERGEELARLSTVVDNKMQGYGGPPPTYVIQHQVRSEVQRMLEFR